MAAANPKDSALFQRMRQQADAAEAEERAQAEEAEADANWEALRDQQGRLYYYNAATGETSWQLPSRSRSAAAEQGTPASQQELKVPLPALDTASGDIASSALSQAVATIQQLTDDVAEQHRARVELEEQLAQGGQQGQALKEITDKSVALLKEKKEATKALDAERQRREQAEAALEQVRTAGGSTEDSSHLVVKIAELEAERTELQKLVTTLEKKTNSSSKLAQMWKQIDADDSGELDSQELKKVMVLMGKDESTLDVDAAMVALDKDNSGSVSFGEFQTWWDAQDQGSQEALTTQLKKENEQLKRDVEGAKTRADKIFRERAEALDHRDQLRAQLSKAMGITANTLPHLAVDTPETNTAATITREEALDLISTIESEEEAREVCKEVGIRSDISLPTEALIMALRGFYDHELTVEEAFAANDADGSGYLDQAEVQCAVAMLGYLVDDEALPGVMAIMDADGGGGVELDEFKEWCEFSMDPKFDQASIDGFEKKLAKREQEQKTTYARLHKLIDDVKELQTTNKELQEAVDAAKAETAAARLEAVAKTTVKTAPANAAPSEELDAALAKISMLQSEVGELQPLVAERDRRIASTESEAKALKDQLTELREEYDEVVSQRDALRTQLSNSVTRTSATMKRMADHQSDQSALSASPEEAMELLEMLHSEEEAQELCIDLGMQVDDGLPMKTLVAALKGHFDRNKTVEEVFAEMDQDESGYLDIEEVRAAIAMLGFAVDSNNLDLVMKEMDPDGDGEVTLDEFQQWWSANISIASSGTVGSSSAQEEINELRIQLAEANEQLKRFESHKSTMKGPDPLGYVQSARSKLRTITPGDEDTHGPLKIDIDTEEATELLELIEDEAEAQELCRETGIELGNGDISLDTMKSALRGHLSQEQFSVEDAFDQLDVDESGYLDRYEVEQAIALLGFLTDDVEELMNEMDPNGDGQVSFEEFEAWWKVNMEGGAKDTATTNAAVMQELADLRRQLEAAVARGTTTSGEAETDREVVVATSERLEAAEADAADAKSELAAMTKQLAQVETKLAAAEIKDEGANAMQQEVVELRAKLDAAEKAASVAVEVSDPMGMMAKLQECMERAARAEAEQAVASRERDKLVKELAAAKLGDGRHTSTSRHADGATIQKVGFDDDAEDEDLQEHVEMLEQVVAARDAEVKALTEKLKAFASETRKLIEQLKVETTKSRELAEHYSALQRDLDAAESRLDEMAQLNRTLVGQISELKGRLQSHQLGGAPDEV